MPIYEYECRECAAKNEFLIGVGQGETEILCSQCGSEDMEKVISPSNLSVSGHMVDSHGGKTCCGREERCDTPPCSGGRGCRR